MNLTADYAALSRLLEAARDMPWHEREPWLDGLPTQARHLEPQLREMLEEIDHPKPFSLPPLLHAMAAASGALPGERVGLYRLIREIGRGGMASVWLAERTDGTARREIAIKMPLLTMASGSQIERFERERDVLARLTHPRIARLYDVGVTARGQPFIVLECVTGLPITEACDTRRSTVPARLRLFLQVLSAVEHAHKHLVVHRDIKPSNVFVDDDAQVKLLDFGIAKLLDPDGTPLASDVTHAGDRRFTPRYAAPEQVSAGPISTATDIYSLGVLLYELLTGTVPHAGAQTSAGEAVHAALYEEPLAPSAARIADGAAPLRGVADAARLHAVLAGDLDTIVMKALRKQPAERYGSVERFAEDIERYLDHRPIQARRPTLWHRSRLFLRRNRAAGIAAAIGAIGALGLGGMAVQQHLQSVAERTRGDTVRDFMFDLVGDAEPDDKHPDAEPTGRQMLEGAVRRARESFGNRPRIRAELLAELGRMLGRLGDGRRAAEVIQEALAILEEQAPPGDPALNKTRAHLADALLEDGQMDVSRQLAETAAKRCQDGIECAKARYYASVVLANIALRQGEAATALKRMREGVADCATGFGARHAESALALMQMAVVARQAGELADARKMLDSALEISRSTPLRAADSTQMNWVSAVLSFDLGDYAQARERLLTLIDSTTRPSSLAQQWRLLATTQLARGEVADAQESATRSIEWGEASTSRIEVLLARQAQARALSLAGSPHAASEELAAVVQGLGEAGFAPGSMEVLRARRFLAEVLVRDGRYDTARQQLEAVARQQSESKAGQQIEWAQTLDLIGGVLRETGRPQEALAWHAKAREVFEARLPAGHPMRLRNALYEAAAKWRSQPSAESAQGLQQQAAEYARGFPAGSVWKDIVQRSLQAVRSDDAQAAPCALFL